MKMCVKISEKTWWNPFSKANERVIVDPSVTFSRAYLWLYLMINIEPLSRSISMVMVEKYIGFWAAFLMPTALLCKSSNLSRLLPELIRLGICPIIMLACNKRHVSILRDGPVLWSTLGERWSWNVVEWWVLIPRDIKSHFAHRLLSRRTINAPGFWDDARPSHMTIRPNWMIFADEWVDDLIRGLKECSVLLWFPFCSKLQCLNY